MLHCHLVTIVITEHDEIDMLNAIIIPLLSDYCGYSRTCEVYILIVVTNEFHMAEGVGE
jgi:hypothetical protein